MTVYTTKYALTRGIQKIEVAEAAGGRFWDAVDRESYGFEFFRPNLDAFERRADAEKKAEEMRARKIESLCRQINKLKNMTFDA